MAVGVLDAASQWYEGPAAQYYPGATVAQLNPNQVGGYQNAIDAAAAMGGYIPGMMSAAGSAMSGLQNFAQSGAGLDDRFMNWLSPEDINTIQGNFEVNPYVGDVSDAFGAQARRQVQENVLPAENLEALMMGQMGSSRHGISEGLARARVGETLQEQLANLHRGAWQDAMQGALTSRGQTLSALGTERGRATNAAIADASNRLGAWGLVPGAMGAYSNMLSSAADLAMRPGTIQSQLGALQQGNAQQQINSAIDRWNFYQNQPLNRLKEYAGIVGGAPNYGPGQVPNMPNPWAAMMSGAAAGLQGGNMLANWMSGGNTIPTGLAGGMSGLGAGTGYTRGFLG